VIGFPNSAGTRISVAALLRVHSRYGLHTRAVTNSCTLIEGFSHFVTSMTAPIASGWSVCRVGPAPTGKRRPCTAHTLTGHSRSRRRKSHRGLSRCARLRERQLAIMPSPRAMLVRFGHLSLSRRPRSRRGSAPTAREDRWAHLPRAITGQGRSRRAVRACGLLACGRFR